MLFVSQIFVVQHVDVCMFSNGKFKNVVSSLNAKEDCPIQTGRCFKKTYTLLPLKGSTKNWIALEESYNKKSTSLASTVTSVSRRLVCYNFYIFFFNMNFRPIETGSVFIQQNKKYIYF